MRIGVNLYPSFGGSGALATRLSEHLAERGHTMHLVTYMKPFLLSHHQGARLHIELIERLDYPLFRSIGQPYSMSVASRMLELTADPGLDVMHVHYAIPHVLSAYAVSKLSGVPFLVTLHGSDAHSLGWSPSYREIMRRILEEADAVTTVSEFLKKRIVEKIGVEREVHVIRNFIDTDQFSPSDELCFCLETGSVIGKNEATTAEDSDGHILFHASNFRAGKRVAELMDAFRLVVDSHPKAHLLIAGDGPEKEEVERRIKSYGLSDNVSLLGFRTDIRELMCCSDIFLLFSNVEGMPLTVIEAMSCGVPVVTTPVGGTPELVRAGQDGIVTETLDEEEYAQSVIQLIDDESLRKKLGACGRKRVLESFSADAVVPLYENLLETIVG